MSPSTAQSAPQVLAWADLCSSSLLVHDPAALYRAACDFMPLNNTFCHSRLQAPAFEAALQPWQRALRPAGTVLVTFKSHQSVPPYRIENQCSDVYIYFVQACLAGERPGRWNWLQPRPNGSALAYAWDEPNEEHLLRVKVLTAAR